MDKKGNITKENNVVANLIELVDNRIRAIFNSLCERFLMVRTGIVLSYDNDNYKALVYFDGDDSESYTYYNKSGEVLSEGDTVKVFYTTNVAKGWIGARMGMPIIEKAIPPYISASVTNDRLVKHNRIKKNILSVDFTVDDNKSDIVFTGVHCCNNITSGDIQYIYSVNGNEQEFSPEQTVSVGNYMIPHTYPMNLPVGQYNFSISIKSEDSIGTTDIGKFLGSISGQISHVRTSQPANNDLVLQFKGVPSGTILGVPVINSTSATWYVDWGDGTEVETIEGNKNNGSDPVTHQYNSDGDYIMTISLTTTDIQFASPYSNWMGCINNFRSYVSSIILPDKTIYFNTNQWTIGATNLSHISFGHTLKTLSLDLENDGNIHSLQFPDTLRSITYCNCINSGLTHFTIPSMATANNLFFKNCKSLLSVDINYTGSANFTYCSSLEKVSIGSDVTSISESMFAICSSLRDVDLTKATSLNAIYNAAFTGCISLEKIFIPDTVGYINSNSFEKSVTTIQGHEGSYAIEYAKTNGYNYEIV